MKKLLVLFVMLYAVNVYCQYSQKEIDELLRKSAKPELVSRSSEMISEGYYSVAERLVDKLLLTDPENANFNYRKGLILSEAYQNYPDAAVYLSKAVKNISRNYDMYSAAESGASPDALYYLGKAYHRINKIDEARKNYTSFLELASKKWSLYPQAELGMKQLQNAQKMQEIPKKNVKVINLGTTINSQYPDYAPVVSFDGSALYFTSRRRWENDQSINSIDQRYGLYPEDIYVSYKDFDDAWTVPVRLDFCDPDQNEASISVSNDERKIYVYQDIVGNGDIFYSDFSTNRFGEIKRLENKEINTDGWDTHCAVSPDGRTMYFSSEREGGLGGRDIYRIVKLPDGTWSEPFNLGPKINSPFDEDAPFMASDNKSLYFASNGTRSMGGFDILVSVIGEDNSWSETVNLGWPLNSTQDDIFYTETVDGRRGYITSLRDDTHGEKDIYEITNDYMSAERGAILKGRILVKNDKPLPESLLVTVICKDCAPVYTRSVYPRLRDGKFSMSLQPCHEYELIFAKSEGGEQFYSETFKTDCAKGKEEVYRELYLDSDSWKVFPPEIPDLVVTKGDDLGEKIHLNPIYFDYRKSAIRPDAAAELDKIVKVMKQRPTLKIELGSHTDARGAEDENQALSESRAKASVAYIISKGISPDRITAKGCGESKLRFSNDEINAMKTGKEKDVAHERNRRTEFIVVSE